jgi:hypothetical protein
MATSCIVNDYVKRKRASLLFNEDNFSRVIADWNNHNQLLNDIQSISVFNGLTKYSQLDPVHFRLLITNAFNQRDKLVDVDKYFDDREPAVAALYILIMGLIYCLQIRTGAAIDTVRINRIAAADVTFEFMMTMMPEERKKQPPSGLRVIVNNTDK